MNSQLDVSENNRRSLIGQFETLLQKLEGAESDKNHLLSHVRELESHLQSFQEKDKATREQLVENTHIKKCVFSHCYCFVCMCSCVCICVSVFVCCEPAYTSGQGIGLLIERWWV